VKAALAKQRGTSLGTGHRKQFARSLVAVNGDHIRPYDVVSNKDRILRLCVEVGLKELKAHPKNLPKIPSALYARLPRTSPGAVIRSAQRGVSKP
jgi:hypothetical protein